MESTLRQRVMRQSRFGEAVREFFRTAGYAEVDTPVLSPFLIPEPAIEVFQTEYLPPKGAARPMWLAPSPELWMKRLLAAGSGDIFQVSRCFRNCEYGGPHHNPEFRLLEWYTVGAGYMDSIAVTEALFDHLLQPDGPGARPRAAGAALSPRDDAGGIPAVRGDRSRRLPGRGADEGRRRRTGRRHDRAHRRGSRRFTSSS